MFIVQVAPSHQGLCRICPSETKRWCCETMWNTLFGLVHWSVLMPDEYRHHNTWMELVN